MAVADEPKIEPFPVIRLCNIPKDERPDWLVEGLWGRQAVGVVGGHPKVGKTWMALEMAVAIASGKPCLDRFPVIDPGPVLVYCVEDGKQRVRARVEGLCHARRLDFSRLAVGWIDANGLALDRPGDQLRLDETIKRTRARAVVFDPLVRCTSATRTRPRRSARCCRTSAGYNSSTASRSSSFTTRARRRATSRARRSVVPGTSTPGATATCTSTRAARAGRSRPSTVLSRRPRPWA